MKQQFFNDIHRIRLISSFFLLFYTNITYNSKTIHGIEIQFCRVVENHKLINLV